MTNKNWVSALTHPQVTMIKRYVGQILQERYPQNEELLERIAPALVTQNDLEAFGRFVVDIYEVAYLKCVEDHRQALEKAGQRAVVKSGDIVNHRSIFQEKSGCNSDGMDVAI